MSTHRLCAGRRRRLVPLLLTVGVLAAASAGTSSAQVFIASETLQLSSMDDAPDDGLLHVGPVVPVPAGGPLYRTLLRFDLPALDPDEVERATLVLRDSVCYYGEGPAVEAFPTLGEWSLDTTWDTQPEVGGSLGIDSDGSCPGSRAQFDVSDLVREWIHGESPELAFELRGDELAAVPHTYTTPDGDTERLDRAFDAGDDPPAIVITKPYIPPVAPAGGPQPVLLSGVVVDSSGAPVSGGMVSVYPSTDADSTAQPLGSATTDARGTFSIAVSPADTTPAGNGDEEGWTNFDAVVVAGEHMYVSAFVRQAAGTGWLADEEDGLVPAAAAPIRIQLDSTAGGVTWTPAQGERTAAAIGAGFCILTKTRIADADRYTVIGEAHAWKDQSIRWSYGQSADSDIGVGYSNDGVHWSISGHVHIGNKRSASIGDTISNLGDRNGNFGRRYRTEFHYSKYRQLLMCPFRSLTSYQIKATSWNGGFDYYDDVKHLNGHCGDFYRSNAVYFAPADGDGRFARSSEDFRTYSGAVNVFGVSLSAQSGASKFASQAWHFGRLFTRYYLCGDTAKPVKSGRIFAGY